MKELGKEAVQGDKERKKVQRGEGLKEGMKEGKERKRWENESQERLKEKN